MSKFFPEGFEAFYQKMTHFPCQNKQNFAVIFSSQKLLAQNYGSEIDTFSNVMRFNFAPTIGYENYVGSKTTHRILNDKVRYKEKDEKCLIAESMGPLYIKRIMQDFKSSRVPQNKIFFKEFYLLNRQFHNVIFSFLMNNFNIQYLSYSSGFIGVFYSIFSSTTPPVVYGFQTIDELQKSFDEHYFDLVQILEDSQNFIGKNNRQILKEYKEPLKGKKNFIQKSTIHDFNLEKKIIRVLEQQKLIVIK